MADAVLAAVGVAMAADVPSECSEGTPTPPKNIGLNSNIPALKITRLQSRDVVMTQYSHGGTIVLIVGGLQSLY